MLKKIVVCFLLTMALSAIAFGQDQCKMPPSEDSVGSPGGDACDDNYSYSSGNSENFFSIAPGAIIFENGYFQIYKSSGGLQRNIALTDLKESPEYLVKTGNLIILPTGSFFGMENDSILRSVLQEYVRLGGTVIVFAQQYGAHIDKVVPIPEGQSLRSYGWREDQSCWSWPYNLKEMHPALAAMAAGTVAADGQFSVYPGNSTVLLRKGSNLEPVLLYYPYGNGTVILTSMYTDWGAAHSQVSASELRLVRDLVTFAKNPNQPIPMYDLNANANPGINLQVKVKNDSEYPAVKAKVTVYTPDRKTVLYQSEAAVSLAAGAEAEVPLSFTLPVLTDVNLGICHTDYELYDADGNLLQMATEADSGRFTPYRLTLFQKPVPDLVCWLTTPNEFVYWDEKPQFILHARNNTDHEITESFTYEWWHGMRTPLTSLTVAAGQTYDFSFEVPLLTAIRNWSDVMESFFVHKTSNYSWQIYKGIRVVYPSFSSKIQTPSSQIHFGDAINYTINSTNTTGKAIPGEIKVKLFREYEYKEIETLYSATHDYGKDETFTYSGNYSPVNTLSPGLYYLRTEVKASNSDTKYNYAWFSYTRSDVALNFGTNQGINLIPGQSYTATFKLKNNTNFKIRQGQYIVTLKSESGAEVFRKEVTNITFNELQELTFAEPYVFAPTEKGKYYLQIIYADETGTSVKIVSQHYYKLATSLLTEKWSY